MFWWLIIKQVIRIFHKNKKNQNQIRNQNNSAMFNMSGPSKIRGSGLVVLNILRCFNIIGLLTVVAASWIMIVMTGVKNNFFFFDAAAHFFTSSVAVFLLISEVNLFKNYFARNWPVLSMEHSFTWLGVAMIIMGCQVLGNLNKPSASIDNLGLPMWRLVLAAGILSITFGFFNLVSSLIYRDGKNGITARMVRIDGQLAAAPIKDTAYDYDSTRSASIRQEKRGTRFGLRFPIRHSKIKISKPIPQNQDLESAYDHQEDRGDDTWAEDRASPVVPDIQRPPTALHPIHRPDHRYSEAAMSRF
ncbi:hypothetical protein UCRPA7_4456 [Phaeoacremonium minimum UCRPA7]|uniref:DUF7598 domain-containing protein n=1 Tax=Phaeoacremonium minimum (strain UCR-PA7) TaxID=1286976 RepID=R8BKW5_PHAM7|nr:hypothetical protein UCRPA7_4456 [Phaeoacremonium minimum UCRPA7]EOO00013.1 hypothetical protein UCRPA7_4456 [Phaeoacremonium minimum UCRPA7]